jgi:hypothetical protein
MVLIEVRRKDGQAVFINPDQIVQLTTQSDGVWVHMTGNGSFYAAFAQVHQFLDYLLHAKPAFSREV